MLPLFQDWTFATLASLPSVSQVGEPQPPLTPAPPTPSPPSPPSSPCAPPLCKGTPQPVLPPQPHPSSPCNPHRCQGCQELISLVRRLTFQLEALHTEVHRMARAAASPPSRLAPTSPSPHASTPLGAHPQACSAGHLLHLATLLLRLHLPLLSGFALVVAARLLCSRSVPQDSVTLTVTVTGVLSTALLFLSPSLLLFPLDLLARPARVVHQVALLLFHPLYQSEVSATLSPSCTAPLQTSRLSGTT